MQRHPSIRNWKTSIPVALLCTGIITCTSPTDAGNEPRTAPPPAPPEPPPPPGIPASIVVNGLGQYYVNQMAALTVTVKDQAGRQIEGYTPQFTSADTSIAQVSSAGVVRGIREGLTRVDVAVEQVKTSVPVRVVSRLRLGLDAVPFWYSPMRLAVGDTVRLQAYTVDGNGGYVGSPIVTWSSSNPDGVSVDSTGMLRALKPDAEATITISGFDGVATLDVIVNIPVTGTMATVRFAHAAQGAGPITFVPTKGSQATVREGESATIQVPPGILLVEARGIPQTHFLVPPVEGISIRAGEKVTVAVMGHAQQGRMRWMWSHSQPVHSDSTRLTVTQGLWGMPVMYIRGSGEAAAGIPEACYFDSMDMVGWTGKPGAVNLIMLDKLPSTIERYRLTVDANRGQGYTIFLTGTPATGVSYFAFPEL
jgi:hypothetical protein